MNRIRVFTSGGLFLFAIYCLLYNSQLPFQLPQWIYIIAFLYFAFFPIKDMISGVNTTLYKGRQFAKNYTPQREYDQSLFQSMISQFHRRAVYAMIFWLTFMMIPGSLYILGYIDKIWIFVLFTLSNFSVFYAIFGWCPFHSLFIRPECCMECRIYNWDSFFQYSFLIFLPHPLTIFLFLLGLISLIQWEITYHRYPERFYKLTNAYLTCEHCDLDACRQHKKKPFHKTLKEEYKNQTR